MAILSFIPHNLDVRNWGPESLGGFSEGHTSGRSKAGTQLCWIPKPILLIPRWVGLKVGPQTSGISITWGPVRHAHPQASPHSYWFWSSWGCSLPGVFNKRSGDSDAPSVFTTTALGYRLTMRKWHQMRQVTWVPGQPASAVISGQSHSSGTSFFMPERCGCVPSGLLHSKCSNSTNNLHFRSLKWCDCSFPNW